MEINTTRVGGGLSTSTPGISAFPTVAKPAADMSSMGVIADYLAKKRAPAGRMSAGPVAQQVPAQPMPSVGQASLSDNLQKVRAQAPVTRTRRVRSRMPLPVYGGDVGGITYEDKVENLLPDGSWSLDGQYGTLAGNEAAAMKGPMDITKLASMNFSGLGGGTWGLPQVAKEGRS